MVRLGSLIPRARRCLITAALGTLIIGAGAGWAQPTSSPPPVQEPVAAPTPSPREEKPGLMEEIGNLFGKSLSILPPLKTPGEAIDDLNARAKDASDSLLRLAKPSSMVSGRTICPTAADGTPDCKSGANKLCQSKGYKEGKSLNTDSAETCSAKVLIPGRARKPGDCRMDNYVTHAICQE
ncbi:MAG TPA: hypothetical protein VH370_06005 [Humisphaera sp.]|nr:hypothetical protein [Humisphaera sp.]